MKRKIIILALCFFLCCPNGCVALYCFFSPEVHEAVKDQPNSWVNFWSLFDNREQRAVSGKQ